MIRFLTTALFIAAAANASAANCFCTVTLNPGNTTMSSQAWPGYVQLTQKTKCSAECNKYLGTLSIGDILMALGNSDVNLCGTNFSLSASSYVGTSTPKSAGSRSISSPGCPQCSGKLETTTLLSGVADQFAGPVDTPSMSPPLSQFFQTKPVRKLDEGGIDKPFGTSFDLGTARTFCAATLEMNLRRESNPLDWNDKVYVYLGTIAAPNLVISAYAWPSSTLPSPRVVKIPLPSSILTSLAPGRYLSVILQDDTAVDYVRLVYSWK